MNSTNNTYYSLDYWLKQIDSFIELDILHFLLSPLALLSFIFNSIAFIVLSKRSFSISSFYKYMRLYVLNSAILSLLITTTFTNTTHRIFSFTNSFPALVYGVYFYTPAQSILYLYSSFLEICILIEKMLFFLPTRFKKIKFIEFNKFFILLFILSVLINLPMFVLFEPTFIDVPLGKDEMFRIYFFMPTVFSFTIVGRLFSYLFYLIRDALTLIMKIFLNMKSVYLIKQYSNRIMIEKSEFALKISSPYLHEKDNRTPQNAAVSKADRNQTYMAIILCFFSLLEHILYLMAFVLYFFNYSIVSYYLYYFAILSLTFKHTSNILVFYKFNFLFRTEIKKFLKLSV